MYIGTQNRKRKATLYLNGLRHGVDDSPKDELLSVVICISSVQGSVSCR